VKEVSPLPESRRRRKGIEPPFLPGGGKGRGKGWKAEAHPEKKKEAPPSIRFQKRGKKNLALVRRERKGKGKRGGMSSHTRLNGTERNLAEAGCAKTFGKRALGGRSIDLLSVRQEREKGKKGGREIECAL